jgi:hypothetical protein
VKEEDEDPEPDEEREERSRAMDGSRDALSCNECDHYLLASKFNESGSDVHGTSSAINRTHPLST